MVVLPAITFQHCMMGGEGMSILVATAIIWMDLVVGRYVVGRYVFGVGRMTVECICHGWMSRHEE